MKPPDLDKERSERLLSLADFKELYNEDLPQAFPKASTDYLEEFKKTYTSLFKKDNTWSLDRHRKKFMDWLPQRTQSR